MQMYVLKIATFAHGIRKVEIAMRIISQDGRIDLPYENICLYIDSTLVSRNAAMEIVKRGEIDA